MRNSKKGFTIVELVIVIAVIAILAAVLIPTFSSVTNSARESAAQQEAKAGLDSVLALTSGSLPEGTIFAVSNNDKNEVAYTFAYKGNKLTGADLNETGADPTIEYYQTNGKTDDTRVDTYAVYVSASCWIKNNGGSIEEDNDATTAAKNREKVEALILSAINLKGSPLKTKNITKITIESAKSITGAKYFVAKAYTGENGTTEETSVEFQIYYTTDIQTTQVIFIGHD